MRIIPAESRPTRPGPAAWFTGNVLVDEVITTEPPARLRAARVTFAPGARTAWHTHPVGQSLHVLSGLGWIQKHGEPAQPIRPGDSVWIAPGELHWHGAQATHSMVHLAMQEHDDTGSVVTWLDHVTDNDYEACGR